MIDRGEDEEEEEKEWEREKDSDNWDSFFSFGFALRGDVTEKTRPGVSVVWRTRFRRPCYPRRLVFTSRLIYVSSHFRYFLQKSPKPTRGVSLFDQCSLVNLLFIGIDDIRLLSLFFSLRQVSMCVSWPIAFNRKSRVIRPQRTSVNFEGLTFAMSQMKEIEDMRSEEKRLVVLALF